MAYQAAYFSLYGKPESTYEPAMMKAFLHGRTEAIRSVTPQYVSCALPLSYIIFPSIDESRLTVRYDQQLSSIC